MPLLMPTRLRLIPAFCLVASLAHAQQRPITSADFPSWKAISGQVLSNDGHYLAYGLFPQEGDGVVIIRDLKTSQDLRIPAGELPPPPAPDPASDGPAPPQAIHISFSPDTKTLAFLAYPTHAAVEKSKDKKQAPPPPAHDELVMIDLTTSKPTRIPDVKSFQLPDKGTGFIAYLKFPAPEAKKPTPAPDAPADEDSEDQARGGRAGATGSATPTTQYGSLLTLRSLPAGTEKTFPDVLDYQLAKDAKSLAYSVASPRPETDGVFLLATSATDPKALITGKGRYEHLTFDEKFDQLAFIGAPASDDPESKHKPLYNLYLWHTGEPKAADIVSTFHPGYILNDHATINFSKDATRLFFGAAPAPPPAHATAIDPDKPSFDLWRYQDDYIQPAQKVRATADLNRSFRAEYLIKQHKMIQLADETMPELTLSENSRYALGADDRPYRAMLDYDDRSADYYLVDTDTGTRTLLLKKHQGVIRWSADGKYLLTFDSRDWSTIAVPSGKVTNLTAKLPAKFFNEENDVPGLPGAYGAGAWTKDDKAVLLYDHWDIWQVTPDGSNAINLTAGAGRKAHTEFRYIKLDSDPEARTIDPSQPVLLRAEDTMSHDTGFYTTKLGATQPPARLTYAPKDFSNPIKARDADVVITSTQSYTQFPDLLVTNSSFAKLDKVTDANPQQAQLQWGTDEMVPFQSLDGVNLQGILYKPANFDPSKKYPMIVYLYEKLSQNINHFVDPKPMDSINISYYVSNGYLVFTPDIVYTTGYPGQSALKCVLAGVSAVSAKGFVDEKNIGIQGHSWGGYQIAYMVTQTNRFKAAEDGAPVVNMFSAYDGIRWGPGRPRQFQYEISQSRIGGTPWQYPLRFIDNSPLFQLDRVTTPLLIVHNDADDAVPWYQGIEMFLALRRLGKEAYMFTYNGEPHHLRRRANQKDYSTRMAQFFDYELKAGPKPKWMESGIPYNHTAEQTSLGDDNK